MYNEEKRRKIVEEAYEKSLFYKELISTETDFEVFESLPIVSAEAFRKSSIPVISMKYMMASQKDKLIYISTSGSTGKCLEVVWDKNDYKKSLLPLWLFRKKYYNINPNDKFCFFYTIRNLGENEVESIEDKYSLGFSKSGLDEKRMLEIYNEILSYDPIWLSLQPSMAMLLLQTGKKYNLPKFPRLRYIEFSGEILLPSLKTEVKNFFECDVANQYGCYEVNSIAYECNYGNMHCMESNVYTEIVDKNGEVIGEGEEGEIVITSLENHATPFIRYNIGDIGVIDKKTICRCGNKSPIIKLLKGRKNDWITNADGTKTSAYIFARAIENINYVIGNVIIQFQIIQKDIDYFFVKVVIDEDIEIDRIIDMFKKNILQPSLINAKFEFEFSRQLFRINENEKYKFFINEIENKMDIDKNLQR